MSFDYMKRSVVVEAVQFVNWQAGMAYHLPGWLLAALQKKTVTFADNGDLMIDTLEGVMRADVGDYIIKGVQGELYPCKPEIFRKLYDKVSEPRENADQMFSELEEQRMQQP